VNRYLLDTNHLSAYLDRHSGLQPRVDAGLRKGDRFGICLPVRCEYRAGIRLSRRHRQNLARFQAALRLFRLWPSDADTAAEFAEIFRELRTKGPMLSQFDLLIAAVARQSRLILLTADKDFEPVKRLRIENWL
jgi:predicted nucleic acid-binding protein